jgi:hypothetical protein
MNTLKHYDTEFFSADIAIPVEHTPGIQWKKARISAGLWQQIVGFMIWSQQKYGEEAQLRLFYNTDSDEWQAVPYPQKPMGMTTKELDDEPELLEKLRAPVAGTGWVNLGTVHHHCKSSAFQSGTDEADERNQPGFHITLGNLESDELDAHCRFSHNGGFVECNLWDFVDYPVQLAQFTQLIPKWYLLPVGYEFPAVWTESIIKSTFGSFGNTTQEHSWYSHYEQEDDFVEYMMFQHGFQNEDEVSKACKRGSPYYDLVLDEAKAFFDADHEKRLQAIYDEYTTSTVYNGKPLGSL